MQSQVQTGDVGVVANRTNLIVTSKPIDRGTPIKRNRTLTCMGYADGDKRNGRPGSMVV